MISYGSVTISLIHRIDGKTFIIGDLNLSYLWKIVKDITIPGSHIIFATNKYGNYIAHSNFKRVLQLDHVNSPLWFKEIKSRRSYKGLVRYFDRLYVMGAVFYPQWEWTCASMVPLSNVLLPLVKTFSISMFVLVLLVIFGSFLSKRWIHANIEHPITALTSWVHNINPENIKDGDMVEFTLNSRFLEFEVLKGAFDEFLDITARYQSKLQEAESRFRKVVEFSPAGILICRNGLILYANKAAQDIFEYSTSELIGKELSSLLAPEEKEDSVLSRAFLKYSDPYKCYVREVKVITKNGKEKILQVAVSTIKMDADELSTLIYAVDITALKHLQEERTLIIKRAEQSQRIEAIGTLAGGVAHEFNNLLQIISLNVEMLKKHIDSDGGTKFLENIFQARDRAAALIESLLIISRRKSRARKSINVNEEAVKVVEFIRETLPKNIKINFVAAPQDCIVGMPEGSIEQILLNLLTNARDAIGEKEGIISVRMERVTFYNPDIFNLPNKGEYIKITVEDSGPGIPEEIQSRIFEPFFTTKEPGKGTGLGLSVIRGLILDAGGNLLCDNNSNYGGARFSVLIPLLEASADESEATEEERKPGDTPALEGINAVVVEDEELVLELIKQILIQRRCSVRAFNNPGEALSYLRKSQKEPDFVLLDLGLPGMGGRECAEEIKKIFPSVPIILMSGFLTGEIIENAKKYGIFHFLSKPFTTDSLFDVIKEVLKQKSGRF